MLQDSVLVFNNFVETRHCMISKQQVKGHVAIRPWDTPLPYKILSNTKIKII